LGYGDACDGVDDLESEMTQPAKVQEPSMEEILASIRRIIADDEGKPPAADKAAPAPEPPRAEKPAAPAAKPVMNDIPPSRIPAAVAAAAKAPPPPAPAAASASNNQDDIDALLAGLDETTTPEEVRPAQPEPEVLELTDDMAVAPPISAPSAATGSFRKVEPQDDIDFIEPASRAAPKAPTAAYDSPAFEATARQAILSQNTVNSVESAFNALANTVLSNNARTLEDLVKEMLRPMLKSWLDDNLPALVERIVKAEIERVSRGR
jgi:cell pole-organizing protein PopZ